MDEIPVVHLPERDYDDPRKRRDWQLAGYATCPAFRDHPLGKPCAACSGPDLDGFPEQP